MIDHVSIAVRDIKAAETFLHGAAGHARHEQTARMAGRGHRLRQEISRVLDQRRAPAWRRLPPTAACISACARATTEAVDAFHAAALAAGGASDGAPGLRAQYSENYYAAFIRDADGNRIEAVTFVTK